MWYAKHLLWMGICGEIAADDIAGAWLRKYYMITTSMQSKGLTVNNLVP